MNYSTYSLGADFDVGGVIVSALDTASAIYGKKVDKDIAGIEADVIGRIERSRAPVSVSPSGGGVDMQKMMPWIIGGIGLVVILGGVALLARRR